MALVLLALITLNIATGVWLRLRRAVTGRALLLVLIFDVAALSVQLWLSGGAVNPFISLFLLQVTLGAVLLYALSTWIIVVLACLSVVGLTRSEERRGGQEGCSTCRSRWSTYHSHNKPINTKHTKQNH